MHQPVRLPPPPSPRRSPHAPRRSAGGICPTAAGSAVTGSAATSTAPADARSSSASPAPGSPVAGRMPQRVSTATCSTSSATAQRAPTLRAALDEARAFLALPPVPNRVPGAPDAPYDATEAARRLWRRCRAIDGQPCRTPSPAPAVSSRCRFAALRFHPALRYREGAIGAPLPGAGRRRHRRRRRDHRRATHLAGSPRARQGGRRERRARRSAASTASRCASARPSDDAALVVGEGIETVLSLVTAVPEITAAAALSAGSLGAFAPPAGIARLAIARDNDEDGALAAERLARRCARLGIAATVIVPIGNDFNDDLVDLGAAALRARFAPLFRAEACAPASQAATGSRSGGGREKRRVGQADPRRGGSVDARNHEPAKRAQTARRVRICAGREQHRAHRPPHQVGEPVPNCPPARDGDREQVDRALPRGSLAAHPGGRGFAGRARGAGRVLAGLLVRAACPVMEMCWQRRRHGHPKSLAERASA